VQKRAKSFAKGQPTMKNATFDLALQNKDYFDLKSPKVKVKTGQFTHCYIHPNYNYVIMHSDDLLKECYSLWLHEENPHLPEIARIAPYWFIMPKYKNLTKRHKKAYAQYKQLMALSYKMQLTRSKSRYNYDLIGKFIDVVHTEINETLAEGLQALLDCATNATSNFCFDRKQENYSVDNDGNLILRDIYADLDKVYTRKCLPPEVLYTIGSTHDDIDTDDDDTSYSDYGTNNYDY